MAKENKSTGKVPNLRFPGFEGEWEDNNIGDLFEISAGGDIAARYVSKVQTEEFKYPIYANALGKKGLHGYSSIYKVEPNAITVTGRGVNIGIAHARNHRFYPIVRLLVLKPIGEFDIFFFEYCINNLGIFIESTGVPQLTAPQISSYKLSHPKIAEQQKIANFLLLLDKRIETQNKIIKELNRLKATVTKKIFLAKLRFKDKDGNAFPEWRKMKLGDIGEIKMCKRIFNHETSSIGEISFFKIGSFGKEADAFIPRILYMDYKTRFSFPKVGDVLISAAGTIGRTVVYKGEDAYYQDSNIVWIDNDNSIVTNEFLYYILQNVKYNTEGGTIQRLYNNILKSTRFSCPALPEQRQITTFLSSIDSKINVEGTLLKTLEQQKKYLLQKMFV